MEYGLGVEAMMPLRPGGEDWVGVEPAWCSCGVFYILPFCAFSLRDEEGGFARRFFYGKLDSYSKYVCCISASCVMNKYYLNQILIKVSISVTKG